jgi:simple sugar transport system substrate-binding protein
MNNLDTTAVGWVSGPGLSEENQAHLDTFIAGLADGSINLWTGPLNNQDGSVFLAEGETATDQQVWYTKQLLEGIDGASEPPA